MNLIKRLGMFKVMLMTVLLPLHAQADVYIGSNVRIGSNVTVNSNKIKVNNTTVNEDGITIPASPIPFPIQDEIPRTRCMTNPIA